jgi:hypothetical protein
MRLGYWWVEARTAAIGTIHLNTTPTREVAIRASSPTARFRFL